MRNNTIGKIRKDVDELTVKVSKLQKGLNILILTVIALGASTVFLLL